MADAITVDINSLGAALFQRSKRAKHINIYLKPFRGIRVAVPDRVSFNKAEEFARSKFDWIKKQSRKMKQYEKDYHRASDANNTIDKATIKKRLTERLQYLAEKHGFTYNKVYIRNQRTRWGSCSHRNNISLNMNLIFLPEELRDYVILHELVHTNRKDHSQAFWTEMNKLVGDGKNMSSTLKKYVIGLY